MNGEEVNRGERGLWAVSGDSGAGTHGVSDAPHPGVSLADASEKIN